MSVKHSLVVPCFNEEDNIEPFFEMVKTEFKDYTENYEIVFVNDGSVDLTGKKLKELFEKNKDRKITVVEFSRNFGKEAAIYAGLKASRGEYVTIIDADLQQDASYAVKMGRLLDEDEKIDMVACFQKERKEGKSITFLKESFYRFINKVSEVELVFNASDFRTMRRSVVTSVLSLVEYNRFSKGIFSWVGYNTATIPYEVKERTKGNSKWNFKKLFKYALDGIVSYTDVPLKLPFAFSAIAFLAFIVSFVVGIVFAFMPSKGALVPFSFAVGFFLFSLLFLSLGILGYYLGKVYSEEKNRPIFIAKEILTYEEN